MDVKKMLKNLQVNVDDELQMFQVTLVTKQEPKLARNGLFISGSDDYIGMAVDAFVASLGEIDDKDYRLASAIMNIEKSKELIKKTDEMIYDLLEQRESREMKMPTFQTLMEYANSMDGEQKASIIEKVSETMLRAIELTPVGENETIDNLLLAVINRIEREGLSKEKIGKERTTC
jgi:hypothetical protein